MKFAGHDYCAINKYFKFTTPFMVPPGICIYNYCDVSVPTLYIILDYQHLVDTIYLYIIIVGANLALPVGEHQFPFSFNLPVDIPSSYQGRYGRIRYTMVSVISYMTNSNKRCSQIHGGRPCNDSHTNISLMFCEFDVNSLVDLNIIPRARVKMSAIQLVYNRPLIEINFKDECQFNRF